MKPASGADYEGGAYELNHKFGSVLDAYQVVGQANEIEHLQAAERGHHHESVLEESVSEVGGAIHDVASDHKHYREEHHGHEGYATKARDEAFVDFSFVHLVKEVAAIGDEQNLRNEYAGKKHAEGEDDQCIYYPVCHDILCLQSQFVRRFITFFCKDMNNIY